MTREEAIEEIRYYCQDSEEIIEAINQFSEDCVSRQAVLAGINDWWGITGEPSICDYIRELPPVTPTTCIAKVIFSKDDLQELVDEKVEELAQHMESRWIPVSEGLPKENGHYLVTFHQTATEEDLGFDMDDTDVRKMRYDTKHGWRTPRRIPSWINDAVVSTVLAWMPLPEPYKAEMESEE